MNKPACPLCEMTARDTFPAPGKFQDVGHEWERTPEPDAPAGPRIVKDAHGNILADGDVVMLIKDLPLKGSSQSLKGGTKSKPIRLVDGDHEISCKLNG